MDGLLPVVIQDDATHKVLMVGFMNQEAYEKTMLEGIVTFYSRSKQRLWTKGETSGNQLSVVSVAPDCDADSLLVRVVASGPVCHTGSVSCFDVHG
jgi:phosphoribosyl-ATP pyrophosphohydrolase/phosphoribosyl-AMP cyclohydrolase